MPCPDIVVRKKAKVAAKLIINHVRPLLLKYNKPVDFFPSGIVGCYASCIYEGKSSYKSATDALEFILWLSMGVPE